MAVDAAIDRRVVSLAAENGAQLTHRQLTRAGMTPSGLKARVARGLLVHLGRQVYGLPAAASLPWAAERTAVLQLGPAAVLSHGTAAAMWQIAEPVTGLVAVTLVETKRRGGDGLELHRVQALHGRDRGRRHGLPVTAPARTILDLAGSDAVTDDEVLDAVDRARSHWRISDAALAATLERSPRRKGATRLRALMADDGDAGFTRSKAERRLRAILRRAHLPQPVSNVAVAGRERDAVWREQRLVVEFDGWRTHGTRAAFEDDRRRDQMLAAAGWRVIRFTWRQLTRRPEMVAAVIAAALVQTAS